MLDFKFGLLGFVIILITWQLIASSELFLNILLPGVVESFLALGTKIIDGLFLIDLGLTLYRTAIAFAISVVIGIPVGLALGHIKLAYKIFQPVIDFFRSIPATAVFPLFVLFFGISNEAIFAAAIFGSVFLIILNAMYGVNNANKSRILYAQTLNATRFQIFREVIFYEALPYIFVGLRQALSLTLIIVVVTEMFFGTASGLGYRIFNSQLLFKTPEMYGLIVLVGIVGYLINLSFNRFEKKTLHWVGQ